MSTLGTQWNRTNAQGLLGFTQGIEWDKQLAGAEIKVQRAWVKAIQKAGYLQANEADAIQAALNLAKAEIESGSFDWQVADEDIHMNLERFVTEKCGDLGKRMHFGRSRNDLIATTLRLYCCEQIEQQDSELRDLILALCELATVNIDVIVPGATHLQNGQPVRFSHICTSYGQAFMRSRRALQFAAETSLQAMPLGAAALIGSPLKLDWHALMQDLGFADVCQNSYDAVADRDFLLQHMQAIAQVSVSLSRLCQDIIYWAAAPVGLVQLPEDWSTGSSIMPNKRNPDVAEIMRAKTGRWLQQASAAGSIAKAINTSYGTDLHELKKVYIETNADFLASIPIFTALVGNLKVDAKVANQLCRQGHILATEIADALVDQGVSFRAAYQQVAALVQAAQADGVQVEGKTKQIEALAKQSFTYEQAVERRAQPGGTAKANVFVAIQNLRKECNYV